MSAYEKVLLARAKDRPTGLSYIENIFEGFIELHGDRRFADDPAIVGGIATLNGQPVTVIAMDKGKDMRERVKRNFGSSNPEGYRKALRLMEQAEKFHRPVVCFVDTAGADSVEFLIYTGALTSGKKLTVGVQTSANAGGSSPEEAEKMVFTASGSTPGLAVVSYRVRGDRGRYVGVTFQHDAGSEVDCAVLAAVRPMYRPPENSWQLVV